MHQKSTFVIHTFHRIVSLMTIHFIWLWEIFIHFLFIYPSYYRITSFNYKLNNLILLSYYKILGTKFSKSLWNIYQQIQSINYAHNSLFVKQSVDIFIVTKTDLDTLKSIHHLVWLLVNVRNAMSFWNFFDILTQA